MSGPGLDAINRQIVDCMRCPRLVAWRAAAARMPPVRFAGQAYWARPLPGFGDPAARILVVGLAPAAHGGNRTGRMFTGDRSGDFLFSALYRSGFASQPASLARDDGLALNGVYVAAVNRCAPPGNRPTPRERDNCLPYLAAEMRALERLCVVIALGAYAWDGALRALAANGHPMRPRPRFGHGALVEMGHYALIGSYHPSQQNTFTGRLTPEMLVAILERAGQLTATVG